MNKQQTQTQNITDPPLYPDEQAAGLCQMAINEVGLGVIWQALVHLKPETGDTLE